jgi:short-subunit dehydrogenase
VSGTDLSLCYFRISSFKFQIQIVVDFWRDKVVMITGASSGIGGALAIELAKRGARLGLVARRADALTEIADRIKAAGSQALVLPADVRDAASLRKAAAELQSGIGPIDVLIANAGVGPTRDGSDLDAAEVSNVININVIGATNSVAAVIPEMVARGQGHLVAISSLAGYRGLPKSAAYCASKAAVSAFFESLRLDLEPKGIAVTIIHPGFIKTPLTAGREAQMPFLMELDDAVQKIVRAIEKRKKSYAFPWQLATIVRAGMVMPIWMYDRISRKNSFRE